MEKQNDNLRERLLARLPQPESLTSYREETASLLARHEKALFWEKVPATVLSLAAVGLFLMATCNWGLKLATREIQFLFAGACVFYFVSAVIELRYVIYRNRVELLKEVKQVQLQILELRNSLQKTGNSQS